MPELQSKVRVEQLTQRQQQILSVIEKCPFPPSIRELGDLLGISSPNGVISHLEALEKKGYIERAKGARGIRVIHPWWKVHQCLVALGQWMCETYADLSASHILKLFQEPELFAEHWQHFNESCPARITELRGIAQWRI